MTFLPIVARELRVAARRRSTFYFRLVAAFLGLIILLWIMLIPELRSPQNLGPVLFVGLAVLAFCYAMLIGLFTTADTVSEEKREGTLGLLFLTDLKGYDIVLGKLVANSVSAVYGLLALFPIMAIPLLAGGVSGAEFTRVVAVMLNSVFFSLALGMLVSALVRDERMSMSTAFISLIVFAGGLPLLGALLTRWSRGAIMHPAFYLPSPAFTCIAAFHDPYQAFRFKGYNFFQISFVLVHVLSWCFLMLACFIVPRSWQDKALDAGSGRRGRNRQSWRFGTREARLALRRRLLALNPFRWLTSRDQMKTGLVWIFLGVAALLWLWGLLAWRRLWLEPECYMFTALSLQAVLKLWLAGEACRQFGQDRKSGALELILSTPLSVRQIVDGQLRGLWRQFGGAALVVLAVVFLFLMAERRHDDWPLMCVTDMIVFAADLVTLSWVSMWLGLNARSLHRAWAATVVRILVLPWMLLGVFATAIGLYGFAYSSSKFAQFIDKSGDKFFIYAYLVISLLVDLLFFTWSRHKLLTQFRETAARQYQRRGFFFGRSKELAP